MLLLIICIMNNLFSKKEDNKFDTKSRNLSTLKLSHVSIIDNKCSVVSLREFDNESKVFIAKLNSKIHFMILRKCILQN